MEELPRRARARRRLLLRGPRDGRARPGDPSWVLVVDPIDGTRPAMAGLRVGLRLGGRGAARRRADDGRRRGRLHRRDQERRRRSSPFAAGASSPAPRLSAQRGPRSGCSGPTASAAARRADGEVLAGLIDASSVGGATFDLGSATFDMTRLVTGQLDAYVEPGPRMVEEVAGMRRASSSGSAAGGAQQLALRPRGRGAVPARGGRGRHRRERAPRSATGPCSAPATSSRCRAWRPPIATLHAAIVRRRSTQATSGFAAGSAA